MIKETNIEKLNLNVSHANYPTILIKKVKEKLLLSCGWNQWLPETCTILGNKIDVAPD